MSHREDRKKGGDADIARRGAGFKKMTSEEREAQTGSAWELSISTSVLTDNIALIILGGDVDIYRVQPFKQTILEIIAAGVNSVTIDCSQVKEIDPTGLGVLIGAMKRFRERGGDMNIVSSDNPKINYIFKITGLDKIFTIYATQEEALEALKRQERL